MKFLVLGCRGMAGHTITTYLLEQGHDVTGFARSDAGFCRTITGDAKDVGLIRHIIKSGNYDSVINCIGILNQFAEDNKESAVYLNSYFPHLLAEITRNMNTQIIHMSTDCVFSGKKGTYSEVDFRDGETFYDRSKALGELEDSKNITLRNSIVGPDINENGIGLFNWFMKQTTEIKGFTKAMWTGLTTLELAKVMEQATKDKATGLFNMVNSEPISKFDLINLFNKYMKNNTLKIIPWDGFVCDKSLIRTKFDFEYNVPDYEKMVSEMCGWIRSHKQLYPHYKL